MLQPPEAPAEAPPTPSKVRRIIVSPAPATEPRMAHNVPPAPSRAEAVAQPHAQAAAPQPVVGLWEATPEPARVEAPATRFTSQRVVSTDLSPSLGSPEVAPRSSTPMMPSPRVPHSRVSSDAEQRARTPELQSLRSKRSLRSLFKQPFGSPRLPSGSLQAESPRGSWSPLFQNLSQPLSARGDRVPSGSDSSANDSSVLGNLRTRGSQWLLKGKRSLQSVRTPTSAPAPLPPQPHDAPQNTFGEMDADEFHAMHTARAQTARVTVQGGRAAPAAEAAASPAPASSAPSAPSASSAPPAPSAPAHIARVQAPPLREDLANKPVPVAPSAPRRGAATEPAHLSSAWSYVDAPTSSAWHTLPHTDEPPREVSAPRTHPLPPPSWMTNFVVPGLGPPVHATSAPMPEAAPEEDALPSYRLSRISEVSEDETRSQLRMSTDSRRSVMSSGVADSASDHRRSADVDEFRSAALHDVDEGDEDMPTPSAPVTALFAGAPPMPVDSPDYVAAPQFAIPQSRSTVTLVNPEVHQASDVPHVVTPSPEPQQPTWPTTPLAGFRPSGSSSMGLGLGLGPSSSATRFADAKPNDAHAHPETEHGYTFTSVDYTEVVPPPVPAASQTHAEVPTARQAQANVPPVPAAVPEPNDSDESELSLFSARPHSQVSTRMTVVRVEQSSEEHHRTVPRAALLGGWHSHESHAAADERDEADTSLPGGFPEGI